jgi:signal peptidase I
VSETNTPAAATNVAPADEPEDPVKETRGQAIWREVKGLLWVLLAVLGFHSFIAKPFYIPSESMMPVLLKGDRLVVTKYPYGWSYVSPTIPNPAAIFRSLLSGTAEPWGITLPFMEGRVWSTLPERGDIVIVTPPGSNQDYIKRVIGLPGDTIELRGGRVILNGTPVQSQPQPMAAIPVDGNAPCEPMQFAGSYTVGSDGKPVCRVPIVRETLPNGVSYDTIDMGFSGGDDFGPLTIAADHVFLMGDNRDRSADSRFSLDAQGLGGPVPFENIGGRAEFITFSMDGSGLLGFRSGRAGNSLRGDTGK